MSGLRDDLVGAIERSLVGPLDGPTESFTDVPDRRYISGILYPKDLEVGEGEDANDIEEDGGDGTGGAASARLSTMSEKKPSSMGVSVIVEDGGCVLHVEVHWASYTRADPDPSGRRLWQRHEWSERVDISLPLGGNPLARDLAHGSDDGPVPQISVVRAAPLGGGQLVSVFLTNRQSSAPAREEVNLRCIFSPVLQLSLSEGAFLARPMEPGAHIEEDLASLRLLYRERHEFATGHGCSVLWEKIEGRRCELVTTTFVPKYRQPRMEFHPLGDQLAMGILAERQSVEASLSKLDNLVSAYERWTHETFTTEAEANLGPLAEAFRRHREGGELAARRMRSGLQRLRTDGHALDAFLFMNEAMFLQRLHADEAERVKRIPGHAYQEPRKDDPAVKDSVKWRAFQMAFILEVIPDVVAGDAPNRRDVDLLWVGTGGGKTEAYLGVAAFVFAYRRLLRQPDVMSSGGVAVLMRYTLRLLTIQQFQRAAALLCACEEIRSRTPRIWGSDRHPFLVGLFVGQESTPNHLGSPADVRRRATQDDDDNEAPRTAYEALHMYQSTGRLPSGSSPFQLSHCPWCGTALGPGSYSIDQSLGLTTRCLREGCFFHRNPIPVLTVDDDILRRLPTLLIGTVDKFAQLPFNPDFASLFGHVSARCLGCGFVGRKGTHTMQHPGGANLRPTTIPLPPPDLIIQDELHLLNGPLGSMVGLYEAAIELLCARPSEERHVGPKIIASTATIRRATDQVRAIFVREVNRFPPPGVLIGNSFFLSEAQDGLKDKLYLGVIPSGIGQKTLLKKTLATMLLAVQNARTFGAPVERWDPYWTIVAYFNSIRELGSAKTTIEDDVNNEVAGRRQILPVPELTSNVDSSQLPQRLDALFRPGDDPGSVGILACSNMFSVGVDVTRLGTMVVNSQPKSTSEYVQATGRVGRSKDGNGLVVVLFNWARPRDQSHFERFYDYHQRIQSHVEAITVTPFSDGARDRALHAVYVALVRGKGPLTLCENRAAEEFKTPIRSSDDCNSVQTDILRRAESVSPGVGPEARAGLESFLDQWVQSAQMGRHLAYWNPFARRTDSLVMVSSSDETDVPDAGPRKLTPGSMRNVEKEVRISPVR